MKQKKTKAISKEKTKIRIKKATSTLQPNAEEKSTENPFAKKTRFILRSSTTSLLNSVQGSKQK